MECDNRRQRTDEQEQIFSLAFNTKELNICNTNVMGEYITNNLLDLKIKHNISYLEHPVRCYINICFQYQNHANTNRYLKVPIIIYQINQIKECANQNRHHEITIVSFTLFLWYTHFSLISRLSDQV